MSFIEAKYIDPNLFSGSAEFLRTLVGGYYKVLTDSETGDTTLEFVNTSETEVSVGDYGHILNEIVEGPISKIASSFKRVSGSYTDAIIPKYQLPLRIYGNPDEISNDKEWESFFQNKGAPRNAGLIVGGVYDDNSFEMQLPYNKYNANVLESKYVTCNAIEISYDYNIHLDRFATYHRRMNIGSLQLPNYYFLWYLSNGYEIDETIQFSIDREGVIPEGDIDKILQSVNTDVIPPTPECVDNDYSYPYYVDRSYNLREYLTSSLPEMPLSASTRNYAELNYKHILFDADSYRLSYEVPDYYNSLFPYYAKINFPVSQDIPMLGDHGPDDLGHVVNPVSFMNQVSENKYEQFFLKYLKEYFTNELEPYGLPPVNTSYARNATYVSASESFDTVYEYEDTNTSEYRTLDLLEMMVYNYNNFIGAPEYNSLFMGEKTLERTAAANKKSSFYRHLSTVANLKMLKILTDELISETAGFPTVAGIDSLADLYSFADNKYTEVVAYRIKKISGPTPVPHEAPSMQEFWFTRPTPEHYGEDSATLPSEPPFMFIDSQVKPMTPYTYVVYSYVLVYGVNYSYNDIRWTQQIGTTSTGDYCLQFIDSSGNAVDQLYSADGSNITADDAPLTTRQNTIYANATVGPTGEWTGATSGNELTDSDGNEYIGDYYVSVGPHGARIADPNDWSMYEVDEAGSILYDRSLSWVAYNRYISDAQLTSQDPYLADLHLNFEPTAQIIEVPIATKTITIQDYIAGPIEVEPSYELNDSQTVVFKLNYQPYTSRSFPYPIEPADETYREDYISSNNLLQNETLKTGTRTAPQLLEIYRLESRPKSMLEFRGKLYKQIDLTMRDDRLSHHDMFTMAIFNDRIQTNKKYYYLFRALTKNGIAGYSSEIYETELRSDGGYKYAIFNTIEQDGLDPDRPKLTHFRDLKKLIELRPAAQQLYLDTEDINYTNKAQDEVANLSIGMPSMTDPIWGKTFKVRLTSKKTGKKIDLNISYELQSD